MMKQSQPNNQKDIEEAKRDLQQLQSQELLPPQIKYKLKYLQAIIQNAHPSDYITEHISESQRISLEQMPRETQISIFVSTLRCIAGRETIIYFINQKAYVRKQKNFFKWQKCYISCDSNKIKLNKYSKKPQLMHEFQIQNIFISKAFKNYKNKIIFAIYYDSIKYIIGFDEENTCENIHSIIYKLVKERREYKYSKFKKEQQQSLNVLGLQSKKVMELIQSEEIQFIETIQQKINKFEIASQQKFKLLKNIQSGRIMQDPVTGDLKINMIIKNTNPSLICQRYLQMNNWNNSINTFKVISKIRNNSYICYFKTNKYSYLSYPRESYISVIFHPSCQNTEDNKSNIKNFYLLIQSIPWTQQNDSGAVAMDLNQLIQIKIDYNKNLTLITINSKANFKGYCSVSDNYAMLIHLFQDISKFNQKNSQIDEIKWFQFNLQSVKMRFDVIQSQKDLSLPSDRNEMQEDEFQFSETKSVKNSNISLYKKRNDLKQIEIGDKNIINSLFKILKGEKDDNIIQFIKNKSYYNYYLKHQFNNNQNILNTRESINKDFLLQNNRWKIQNGEYVFIDEKILHNQKDIVKMIVKQFGQNLMSGKSVMNMSLPVQIFSNKSMLDALADGLGFLPYYVQKIKLNNDPVEEMKLISSAFTFIHFCNSNIEKPFNPILGQTFQGKVGNIPIYLEQISHHPPISTLYIKTDDIQVYGNWDINVSIGLNTAVSSMGSFVHVNLAKKKREYVIKYGNVQIGGLLYGNRSWRLLDYTFIYQKNNNMFCQISFGKSKKKVYQSPQKIKSTDIIGGIFKVTEEFAQKFMNLDKKKSFSGLKPENVIEACSFIEGKYYGDLMFDKKIYKSTTDGPFPERVFKNEYLLPSDSIFRQDVIYRIWQQYANSNSQKQRLENLQRNDRKLRQKFKNQNKQN